MKQVQWSNLTTILQRRIRYRIARGGLLFTLALVLVGAGAVVSANNLLFVIVAAMLATLLISGLVSRLVLAALEMELLLPEHITARQKATARVRLRNLKHWMPSFSIRVAGEPPDPVLVTPLYIPVIPGRRVLEEPVTVFFPRRGAHTENLFVFSTRFPFGFLEKTAMVTLRRETVVYPSLEPQAGFEELLAGIQGDVESNHLGWGTDFYRIRPYDASESAHHIDWKLSAHTGALQVREFASDEQRTVEIFLDLSDRAPQDWFEHAVECCAYLAWELAGRGMTVWFRSQEFAARCPEEADIYTILRFLALANLRHIRHVPPNESDSFYQILFSAEPEEFLQVGWTPARVLDTNALAAVDDSRRSSDRPDYAATGPANA